MTACKEDCRMAISELKVLLPPPNAPIEVIRAYSNIRQFLESAEKRLPTRKSIERDRKRKKSKV